jgi:hypothetical protein
LLRKKESNIDWLWYDKELVKKVCAYYEKNGKLKTQKKFPEFSVRSIIERNYDKFSPRQKRWLFKSKNPKPIILKMIKDREL